MNLPDPVDLAVPAFILLVLVEMVVARLRDRRRYCPKDTLTSLGLGFGSSIAGILSGGLIFGLAVWVHQTGCSTSASPGGPSSSASC
jgi:hypothetical protein